MNIEMHRTVLAHLRETTATISVELFGEEEVLANVVIVDLVFDATYHQHDAVQVCAEDGATRWFAWNDVIRLYQLSLDNTPIRRETPEQKTERLIMTYAHAFSV